MRQTEKMLDAAARLFGAQRFHEVRMEDIAAEAEVGKGTLYRYFNDKEELYLALLTRSSQQILDRLQSAVAPVSGARAGLHAIVAGIIDFFDEQPHLLDLIQRSEVLRGPEFQWQETRDAVIRLVVTLLEKGTANGEFTIHEPDLAALMLLGGLRAVIRFGERPRPADLAQRIVQAFLHGAGAGNTSVLQSVAAPEFSPS